MKNAMVEITQWTDKWRQNEHSWRMNYATGKQCWRNLPEESRETKVFCWSTVDLQLISDVQQNESDIYIYFLGSLYYTALQDSAIYIRYLYISIYLYIYPYIYLSFQVLSITGFYKIVNIAPSVILGPCCSSILYTVVHTRWLGFPGDLVVEKPPANAGDRRYRFDPRCGKIPWSRKWKPTLVFLLGKSHWQRRLVDWRPWGHKESNMSESVHTHINNKH